MEGDQHAYNEKFSEERARFMEQQGKLTGALKALDDAAKELMLCISGISNPTYNKMCSDYAAPIAQKIHDLKEEVLKASIPAG